MNWKKLLLIAFAVIGFAFASASGSKAGVSIGIGIGIPVGYPYPYYGYYPYRCYYPYAYYPRPYFRTVVYGGPRWYLVPRTSRVSQPSVSPLSPALSRSAELIAQEPR